MKITGHTKDQENHNLFEKRLPTDNNTEVIQLLKLSDRNFKQSTLKLLHKVITNSLETDEQIENPSKKVESESSSVVSTLCDPMDYTVHGILQARILEWVAVPFFRELSQPRDRTQVSHIAGSFSTS